MNPNRPCSVEGCPASHEARGWCSTHYQRWKKHGDPTAGGPSCVRDPARRFADRTAPGPGGCVVWTGRTDEHGYGRIQIDGRTVRTHRLAWEMANGPIDDGLHVHHVCRNPSCVNPEHLMAITSAEHMQIEPRGGAFNRNKTHCAGGHPYDEANTYVDRLGQRHCRQCKRDRRRVAA